MLRFVEKRGVHAAGNGPTPPSCVAKPETLAGGFPVHRRTVQRQLDAAGKEQTRPNSHAGMPSLFAEGIDNDDDRATLSEEELQAEEESQIEAVTLDTTPARSHSFVREKQLLDEMNEVAEAARGQPDARVGKLIDWIRQNLCPGLPPLGTTQTQGPPARWNENRVLIFTEYKEGREETEKPRSAGTL